MKDKEEYLHKIQKLMEAKNYDEVIALKTGLKQADTEVDNLSLVQNEAIMVGIAPNCTNRSTLAETSPAASHKD